MLYIIYFIIIIIINIRSQNRN